MNVKHVIRQPQPARHGETVVEWALEWDDEAETIDLVPYVDGEKALDAYGGPLLSIMPEDGIIRTFRHTNDDIWKVGLAADDGYALVERV